MDRVPEPEVMDGGEEALVYDLADFSDVNRQIAEDILARLPAGRCRIIDLGTGPADIPIRIWQVAGQCRILAVDASWAMLERARRRLAAAGAAPAIAPLRADANNLPVPDGAFDAVISNSLLHHLGDPLPFWREIKRVARPGGLVFVEDLYRPESPERARAIVEEHSGQEPTLLKELFYQSLLAAFTVEEVRGQLAAAGLFGLDARAIDDRHLVACGRLS